jgi:hypothetical protein
MAYSSLSDLVRVSSTTSGTGTLTLGSAISGFIGVPAGLNGKSVTYVIEDPASAPTAREVGRGVYTSSGATLTRATILASTNSGSAISLGGTGAAVSLSLSADDIANLNPATIAMQSGAAMTAASGAYTISGGALTLPAGTASVDPLTFTAGTNLTSPANGATEYDSTNNVLLFTPSSTSRGVLPANHFVALAADYTLTSTTSAQKLFNQPSNGSLTVTGSTRYFFETLLYLTTMNAASGNGLIDIKGGGTATLTGIIWSAIGLDSTTPTTVGAPSSAFITSSGSAASIVAAGTGTGLYVRAGGTFRVNAGGTLIPSISLVTANAAVVKADSYFRCWPAGAAATTAIGNWT